MKKIVFIALNFVSYLACGGLIGIYMVTAYPEDLNLMQFLLKMFPFLLLMYCGVLLQIILHEAGHLIFGLLSGYSFISFRVANIMLIKEHDKFKIKRMSIAGTAGQCLMEPPELVDGRIPYKLYNLGGVILNFASAAAFLTLSFITAIPLLTLFLQMTALTGIGMGLSNGIPFDVDISNDGSHVRALNKSPDRIRDMWIQLKANAFLAQGKTILDMPESWFYEVPAEEMNDSLKAFIGMGYCSRAMELRQFDKAGKILTSYISDVSGLAQLEKAMLVCDKIYCDLITCEADETSIETLLDKQTVKFMKAMKNFPSVIRTNYALALLLRKDEGEAASYLKQLEKVARTYPYPSDLASERSLMEIAKQLYDEKIKS